MTSLIITDLAESKELDHKAMTAVHGGFIDLFNYVNDITALGAFDINTTASNQSFINLFQANENGNGLQFAPQFVFVTQAADAGTDEVGNTAVGGGVA